MSSSLKDDVFKAVYGYTPKFGKPTPPPHPKTGSKVQVKKKHCTYKTPCGWCTKWDKKCDNRLPKKYRGQIVISKQDDLEPINKICQSEEDHQWECCGVSTLESTYRCKICGKHKTVPIKRQDNVTISTYFGDEINYD